MAVRRITTLQGPTLKADDGTTAATITDSTGAVDFAGAVEHSTTTSLVGATTIGSGETNWTLPTARATTNDYVLAMSDTSDGTTEWKETELPPETTSISPTEVESEAGGNITFTLTGANYATLGMTVNFIATSGSDITTGITVTHTSSTSLSVTIARSAFENDDEPYSIKVQKASGLNHTLSDALRVDNAPTWTDYVATLTGTPPVVASIADNISSATHATLSAIDDEGDTVAYTEQGTDTLTGSGSGKAGMTLNSATGAITGTPYNVTSNVDHTFTARATSTGDGGATTKTTDQQFVFTITPPAQLFSVQIWSGTSSNENIAHDEKYTDGSTARDFQPDLTWIKPRNDNNNSCLTDSVRGAPNRLNPSTSQVENHSNYGQLGGFLADGYSLRQGSSNWHDVNISSGTYVGWSWKAGGAPSGELVGTGATFSGTSGAGTIHDDAIGVDKVETLTQSVNQNTGLSITKYKGKDSDGTATFPHNLGGNPDFVMVKRLDATYNWQVKHKANATGENVCLNEDNDEGSDAHGVVGDLDQQDSDTLIYLPEGSSSSGNHHLDDALYVCYAWKSVAGESKFGMYSGNSNENEVYLSDDGTSSGDNRDDSFTPRYVMLKRIDDDGSWRIFDTLRGTGTSGTNNANMLLADANDAEVDNGTGITVSAGKFTMDSASASQNISGGTFLYCAFA